MGPQYKQTGDGAELREQQERDPEAMLGEGIDEAFEVFAATILGE